MVPCVTVSMAQSSVPAIAIKITETAQFTGVGNKVSAVISRTSAIFECFIIF